MPIPPILSLLPHPTYVHCTLTLHAGQAVRFHARAGTEVHVSDGDVELIEPPLLLAETLHWPRRRLAPGSVVALPRSGWFVLRAQCDTALRLRQRAWVFSRARIARILSGWRRRRLAH
ncbi:hypothetical protein EM868_14180 [Cupriavidus gilardii]|uniref:hypothetical protein n=1 Tax=Cupriavidus gilardii TaxID=82541 RepID=UPI001EE53C2C|nr:hypothetical protein [Cupriavidus gilardii]MCG5260042.1 hypothetical protein [Cupriavidus gilardii]MDF9430939.1 hypothetical protein [Cupriavidus gilardii]